jgi:hypothetical protein
VTSLVATVGRRSSWASRSRARSGAPSAGSSCWSDEKVAAEDLAEDGGRGARTFGVAGEEARPDLTAAAGREGDEVVGVLLDGGEAGQRRFAGMLEVRGADDAAMDQPA